MTIDDPSTCNYSKEAETRLMTHNFYLLIYNFVSCQLKHFQQENVDKNLPFSSAHCLH